MVIYYKLRTSTKKIFCMYKGGANDTLEMQLEDKSSESSLPLDLSIAHIFHSISG